MKLDGATFSDVNSKKQFVTFKNFFNLFKATPTKPGAECN